MKIGIISDTHIGKSLKTNTTIESRAKLKDKIFKTAREATFLLREAGAATTIHTADLFDKSINDETDILSGSLVAQNCDFVMFGNHDDRNRKDTTSSIGLLKSLSHSDKFIASRWEPGFSRKKGEDFNLYFIPHCVSQEVFEASLLKAKESAIRSINNYLFLHCNYDNGLVTDKEQNLNLTEEMADVLLEDFEFIIMGHEHQLAKRKDGRVISVGTTHPTSYSDISEKFVTVIDTASKEVKHISTWSMDNSITVDVNEFVSPEFLSKLETVEFIDVVGEAPTNLAIKVSDAVSEVWKSAGNLIALRTSKIEYQGEETSESVEINLESLPEVMMSELTGEVGEILKEALEAVK